MESGIKTAFYIINTARAFETGLTIKRQEQSRSDKKCQEASRAYFSFILSLKCYILTEYDISHISNIIYWPYNIKRQ